MDKDYDETRLVANEINSSSEKNSYLIVSKNDNVKLENLENVIKIIDNSGDEISCTLGEFIKIFDQEGLEGFIV